MTTDRSWNALLLDQLDFHWVHQLRPRLDGLTDDEFSWEPAPGAWTVRPVSGGFVPDDPAPTPGPPPVTTIGWRLNHLLACVGVRTASHFDRDEVTDDDYPYVGTAAAALARLDEEVETWRRGVRSLGEEGLLRACGPAEGPFAEEPLAALVLHVHRELIHHGAEVSLLRDLYLHGRGAGRARRARGRTPAAGE